MARHDYPDLLLVQQTTKQKEVEQGEQVSVTPDLVALSLGAGVQSTTLALLAVEGVLERPDCAIFADTGWEPRAVYEHLARLRPVLEDAGIDVHIVSKGNLRNDLVNEGSRFASIPYFTLAPEGLTRDVLHVDDCDRADGDCGCPVSDPRPLTRRERSGIGRRQCTSDYKLMPIRRKLRELLGAAPPDYRRVPKGRLAVQWVGFSTDEVHRANRQKDSYGVKYLDVRYPLLDLDMSRADCERWLTARGWTTTKSACIGCPYHGNRHWRDLRDNHPDEWADAVDLDRQIRRGGARGAPLRGKAFLHSSRVPLDQAPIDVVTRRELKDRQTNLPEVRAEEGDPDGCSPYGCRSGSGAA